MRKVKVLCVFVLPVIWSCAGGRADLPVAEKPQKPAGEKKFDESFDPAVLGDYAGAESKHTASVSAFDVDAFLAAGDSNALAGTRQAINGFRVQLVSTRNEEEARAVRTEALLQLDRTVHLTFDNPYYKVRVGNFLTRTEAEKAKEIAIRRGFLDAWVVRTQIQPRTEEEEPQAFPAP
ncbi:SPOR domain-containing protein [candidate division KSB1 bacterium]|nr:SPOR domain-containing protein [candidate division KSB1 bacterium]